MNKIITLFLSITIIFFGEYSIQAADCDLDINSKSQPTLPTFLITDYCVNSSLFYVKMGAGSLPGGAPSVSLGIGGRYRKGHHGVDFSINGQTFYAIFVFDGLLTAKAQYLFYPSPSSRHAIFFGGGSGYGCSRHEGFVPVMGGVGSSHSTKFLTVDGVTGCEFRKDKRIKPLLQLELSQPVIYLKGKDHSQWTPSVVLSIGIGV